MFSGWDLFDTALAHMCACWDLYDTLRLLHNIIPLDLDDLV